eukprot:Opistho-2@90616
MPVICKVALPKQPSQRRRPSTSSFFILAIGKRVLYLRPIVLQHPRAGVHAAVLTQSKRAAAGNSKKTNTNKRKSREMPPQKAQANVAKDTQTAPSPCATIQFDERSRWDGDEALFFADERVDWGV